MRHGRGLKAALADLNKIAIEAKGDSVLENMTLTARLITAAALKRKESRGGHFRADYPYSDPKESKRSFMTLRELAIIDPPSLKTSAIETLASCCP